MRSLNPQVSSASPPLPRAKSRPIAPEQESAAGEEDPGSALDTLNETMHDDEDPDLRFMDEDLALPPDEFGEDENADPVGDGHSDAELAASQPPAPPQPDTQRAPLPRRPPASGSDDAQAPAEDLGDTESHKPGRD